MASKVLLAAISLLVSYSCAQAAYTTCGQRRQCVPSHLCKLGPDDMIFGGEECDRNEICCDVAKTRSEANVPRIDKEEHNGCGWLNKDGIGGKQVTGANEARFGEFPWMVAILRNTDFGFIKIPTYKCGGSLIAPDVVLTAAHCVGKYTADEIIVRGGEYNTQDKNETLPHVDIKIKEILIHTEYKPGRLYNDVALLITQEPFPLQENIRSICLPEYGTKFDYSRCYVTGWGKDDFDRKGMYQVILKKVDLPVVPHKTCQAQLRKTRLGKNFYLHPSFLCAGGEEGKDVCTGDGGAPLVCPMPGVKNRYYQAGIVAWGIGCGENNVPGVYADVAHSSPWISEQLKARRKTASAPIPKGCGWSNNGGIGGKAVTGNTSDVAQIGEFPWMVAILYSKDNGSGIQYRCGGSLIAPLVVLTAANCVRRVPKHKLTVRAGEWDSKNDNEILGHVNSSVKEVIVHEEYFSGGERFNDVALLILQDAFPLQENIHPICLPSHDYNFDYSRCYVTGWGNNNFFGNKVKQAPLKKVDLTVVPRDSCQNYLRQTHLGQSFKLRKGLLCAGGKKDKDICKADIGAALACPIPGFEYRYYQAGILSWGVKCAKDNVPGLCTDVPYFRNWINTQLAHRGIELDQNWTP